MRHRTLRVRSMAAIAIVASAGLGEAASAQTLSATGSTFGTPARDAKITVSGDAQYDSNVARANDAGAAARGLQKEDVRFRPAVEADIALPVGVAVFSLQGTAGYDFYARNTRLNRERIDLTASAGTKLSICDVGLQGGFARAQNDLADLSIVPGEERASTVNVQNVTRIGGSATCGAPVGLRPTGFVEYRQSDNSAPLRKLANFNALSYGGGLSYSSPAMGIATLFAGRSEFDYPNRITDGTIVGASPFTLTFGGVRLDRRLGARLQFNGQLTYVDVDRSENTGSNFSGLNWDVSMSLRAGDRARFSLGTARQINASAGFSSRTIETSLYSLEGSFVFSPLLRMSVTGSHRERNFDEGLLTTPAFLLSSDNIEEVKAGLIYNFGRRLSFELGAGYQDRDANLEIYRYHSYRGSIGAKLQL